MKKIGTGGAGTAYLMNKKVALKQIGIEENISYLELNKILDNLKNINNDFFSKILGAERNGNQLRLFWEFAEGITLREYLRTKNKLSNKVSDSLNQIIEYLNNNNNIIHGDISLDNIIISKNEELKLIDYRLLDNNCNDITIYKQPELEQNITRASITRRNITRVLLDNHNITRASITRRNVITNTAFDLCKNKKELYFNYDINRLHQILRFAS